MAIDWNARVESLQRAISSGVKSVTHPDSGTVEYRSFAEMERELAYAQEQAAGSAPVRRSYGAFSKG